ncbi:MAG: hypothetical protein H7Y13_00840 [Sphingobacteriaceae bacterium]|nr:hypothetical protein [Sphingobacteriaceae bacterium]
MRYLLGNEVSNLLEIPLTQVPLFLPPVLKIRSNFPNLVTGDSAKVLYQQQYNAFKNQNV